MASAGPAVGRDASTATAPPGRDMRSGPSRSGRDAMPGSTPYQGQQGGNQTRRNEPRETVLGAARIRPYSGEKQGEPKQAKTAAASS